MKKQNGITLIALIITIVVLLVLAGVTIGSVKESKIIGHAQDAASEYTIAQEKEKIALAYSEYKIKKAFDNTNVEEFKIDEEDVITEPIGNYGWKVKYEDTGNVYGINLKGEYDEAVSMIIEASEATGLGLDCFMIFEDKYALKANADAGKIVMPEKYVFYNWSKLTDDEIVEIETTYTPTLKSERVENATNRLCVLDMDGDGIIDKEKDEETFSVAASNINGILEGTIISQRTHNEIANICIVDIDTQKTVYEEMVENILLEEDTAFNPDKDFYSNFGNFLLKMDPRDESSDVAYYINSGNENHWFVGCVNGNDDLAYFWKLYKGHNGDGPVKYYGTSRKITN